ncbi:MAG: response regulator [Alphaproteobacteria bacterium]|nr:response regulator [Alphaproteobacteria bacterium]
MQNQEMPPSGAPDPQHSQECFPVVGIGASAGGLDACQKLLSAMPDAIGAAFILVQHLDPTHESLMVELLAKHSGMVVRQAADGMVVEPDSVYVIPPGTYLSVADGALRLTSPQARHGARLPFDFLLHSLADEYGARSACVVLSGTGSDGSLGLKSIKARSGLVIAQDPDQAGYDGMPRSAISTGDVDQVLLVENIPAVLADFSERLAVGLSDDQNAKPADGEDWLPEIISHLRTQTSHDFTLYKRGTLQRRILRRMGTDTIGPGDMARYLDRLRAEPDEAELLAKDLLINVTSFFRDQKVFDFLSENIIPDLIARRQPDNSVRVWIAGCSTGEEVYSLAMLLREQITVTAGSAKVQIFASDADPDAVAAAREGLYPETIAADVSEARLTRFFTKEGHNYRVTPELRTMVVFTVHDVLSDPPFSHLDLISCRNLLIYLRPEAQAKVISLFHFALRDGGLLLLGSSETVGSSESRFRVVSKPERIYRQIGRHRPGDLGLSPTSGPGIRPATRTGQSAVASRQAVLAELCRRMVLDAFAPAAILINRKFECLYLLGPTDRYLSVTPGYPTHDLLSLARPDLRTKLRSAIHKASQDAARTVVPGGKISQDGFDHAFAIDVQPVAHEGEDLLLVCFVDAPQQQTVAAPAVAPADRTRVAELELELEATRSELLGAIRDLELSSEEQKVINEEALSVNEEYQSTNEEILTSKEELQSLNEELTALNSQLQETLEQQRTTANDLENILCSTDLATIFLDLAFNIRFFTPRTKNIFSVIHSDIGRPLADLSSLAEDPTLLEDAQTVARTLEPLEHEVEARNGNWYLRRILPYRTKENGVEGVVITFTDVTERHRIADALEAAKQQAQGANIAKSQFLAAASHDLRQPLQTLTLLQGLLESTVTGDTARDLVARFDETLGAMSGMLNTLLDINQLEVGTVHPERVDFMINKILTSLASEFSYHAQSRNLTLRVMPCTMIINSDPRLLEQMIRNLLSNALKYTQTGKVLLGCRRRAGRLSIEVWDTGIGIPADQIDAIFSEHYQIDNPARERGRGLGLGLSIVQRLGTLLDHHIRVDSRPGQGSMFAIEVGPIAPASPCSTQRPSHGVTSWAAPRNGQILIVEDDPEVRDLLQLYIRNEGLRSASAYDGIAAMEMVTAGAIHPDLLLSDFNLPNGMDGAQLATNIRSHLGRQIPAIILTGDISTETSRAISRANCIKINKPVRLQDLKRTILIHLPTLPPTAPAAARPTEKSAEPAHDSPTVHVVDDDDQIRDTIRELLEGVGLAVEDYASSEAFLASFRPGREACLLIDAYLPGMSGIDLLHRLKDTNQNLPSIMITGHGDVPVAVEAMKAGALDFIEKPVGQAKLLDCVRHAIDLSRDAVKLTSWRETAANHLASLTPRQRQIMELVLAGHPSKNIAADLGISQRTVENHRASIMKKTRAKSLPALARLAVAAGKAGQESRPDE